MRKAQLHHWCLVTEVVIVASHSDSSWRGGKYETDINGNMVYRCSGMSLTTILWRALHRNVLIVFFCWLYFAAIGSTMLFVFCSYWYYNEVTVDDVFGGTGTDYQRHTREWTFLLHSGVSTRTRGSGTGTGTWMARARARVVSCVWRMGSSMAGPHLLLWLCFSDCRHIGHLFPVPGDKGPQQTTEGKPVRFSVSDAHLVLFTALRLFNRGPLPYREHSPQVVFAIVMVSRKPLPALSFQFGSFGSHWHHQNEHRTSEISEVTRHFRIHGFPCTVGHFYRPGRVFRPRDGSPPRGLSESVYCVRLSYVCGISLRWREDKKEPFVKFQQHSKWLVTFYLSLFYFSFNPLI